jgi:hypothetical protein
LRGRRDEDGFSGAAPPKVVAEHLYEDIIYPQDEGIIVVVFGFRGGGWDWVGRKLESGRASVGYWSRVILKNREIGNRKRLDISLEWADATKSNYGRSRKITVTQQTGLDTC